jgi:hypothetical protein
MFRYFDAQFKIPKLRAKDRNCPNDARRYKLCSILIRVRTGRGNNKGEGSRESDGWEAGIKDRKTGIKNR